MKTLTSIITVVALISGLAVANAQSSRMRSGMGSYGEGYPRVQGQNYDDLDDAGIYDPRSTTGVSPNDVSRGQPNEQNQQEERDFLGRTGGNAQHPAR
ncbi:MAG TPA: hypothetical protein VGD13_13495 [Xanthobacteraceae bacterium]|jgi:hypothetical protein